MRRRFGRRRRQSEEGRAPIDPQWLERISQSEAVPVSSLQQLRYEDVPASFALTAVGRGADGEKCLVAVAPGSGGDALLGVVVAAAREAEGNASRAIAISPVWDVASRRRLGALGPTPVPIRAAIVPPLGGSEAAIEREPIFDLALVPADRVAGHLVRPADRLLFLRALDGLRGLAAKHAGSVRGVGHSVELAVLGRRVAVLRADDEVLLDILSPSVSSFRLAETPLPEVLDQLEGFIRKRLNDKKIRDGEEGLRGRLIPVFAEAARLRQVLRWPLGGYDLDPVDLLGVGEDGRLVVGAARQRLGIEGVADILDGALSLESALPILLEGAEAPVQLAPPRLLVAAEEIDGAAECVLGHLALETTCFAIESRNSDLRLREREIARSAPPVLEEPRIAGARLDEPDAPGASPRADFEGEGSDRAARPGRGRSRGSRGRRRSEGRLGDRRGEERQLGDQERAEVSAPRFEEISLFDLDDEGPELSDAGSEGASRRRSRGRGRGRGRGQARRAEGDAKPGEKRAEKSTSAPAQEPDEEALPEGEPALAEPDEAGSRDPRGARGSKAEALEADQLDLVGDPDDADALLRLSPDAPDFEEAVEPVYEDDDLDEEPLTEQDRIRLEREKRRLARYAKAAPLTAHPSETEPEPEEVRRAPRGRAVILAHADRNSILAAVVLARDVRQLEGVWIYPQSELMTFFRGVATDLRENTPIFVIGFSATPVRDTLQAASLYRNRLVWFDHHVWPPEDLGGMREAIGEAMLHVEPGAQTSLPSVLAYCTRRSRFSDKLVDLATGRFTRHDFERWGRLWWWRLGELAGRPGEHRADIEPLLAGRPSDLASEASAAPMPPLPEEVDFVSSRDFRLVHFGEFGIVIGAVPAQLDLHLASRIMRERYGVPISLAHAEGDELLVLGCDDVAGRRAIDVGAMAEHLSHKFGWIESRSDIDHVARFRVRELAENPDRLEEVVREIGLGRAILEG
jgi:hypothetical protein